MKKQNWITYLLLAVMLVAVSYFAYFKPRLAEYKAVKADRIQVEADVELLKIKQRQLVKIEADMVRLSATLSELERIIPRKKEISDILRNVQLLSTNQQVDLMRFVVEREVNRDFYTEHPITVEVAGNYHNVGQLWDSILHFPRLFTIEQFTLKTVANQSDDYTLSAIFVARTYSFLEESQIKKPAAIKPKPAAAKGTGNEI
jgi:type IV pilus assembly protein PilO